MDYSRMSDRRAVEGNYIDSGNLATRISLHDKYSTNPFGLGEWVWTQYRLFTGCRILELGCGSAVFWDARAKRLPPGASLVLTDLSAGMVAEAARRFEGNDRIRVRTADITAIPFSDGMFDIVIANHMLYHLDNPEQAIREVCRALVPGGTFYCTTNGENGIMGYLDAAAQVFFGCPPGRQELSFSLQNGQAVLERCFPEVVRVDYEDSLCITEIDDWLDYVFSAGAMTGWNAADRPASRAFFEARKAADGCLHVPKEAGMFISVKSEGLRHG